MYKLPLAPKLLFSVMNLNYIERVKVREVCGVLIPLKSWLTEQQHKLDTMRPAAVLTAPLTDQITETDVRTLLVRILAIQ